MFVYSQFSLRLSAFTFFNFSLHLINSLMSSARIDHAVAKTFDPLVVFAPPPAPLSLFITDVETGATECVHICQNDSIGQLKRIVKKRTS